MKFYRGIILDLDGTLVDSLADLADTTNTLLRRAKKPVHPIDRYRQFVGNGIKALVQRAFSFTAAQEKELLPVLADFRTEYQKRMLNRTVAYDGMTHFLQRCSALGIRLGVLTNKPEENAKEIVAHCFPEIPFDPVFGGREGRDRKPCPDTLLSILSLWQIAPRDCLYIGDSDVDMQTAHAAGVDALAACWGFRGMDELLPYHPAFVAQTPSEAELLTLGAQDVQP